MIDWKYLGVWKRSSEISEHQASSQIAKGSWPAHCSPQELTFASCTCYRKVRLGECNRHEDVLDVCCYVGYCGHLCTIAGRKMCSFWDTSTCQISHCSQEFKFQILHQSTFSQIEGCFFRINSVLYISDTFKFTYKVFVYAQLLIQKSVHFVTF